MAEQSRAILITGAGGGLGGATARLFAQRGWHVYAADLEPPTATESTTPLQLDVTSTESVREAVRQIDRAESAGLGCVVNFAGVLAVGPLAEIPEDALRRILDINVLGTFRVNQAAFPLLRRGHGRIINISSETGWQRAMLINGPYAMSKHAVEAYTDALRQELMFLDIPVVAVQPGPFKTGMTGSMAKVFSSAALPGSPFEALVRKVGELAVKEETHARDPAELAEVVWTAATVSHPRTRYSVKPDLRRRIMHRLPAKLVDLLLRALLRRGMSIPQEDS